MTVVPSFRVVLRRSEDDAKAEAASSYRSHPFGGENDGPTRSPPLGSMLVWVLRRLSEGPGSLRDLQRVRYGTRIVSVSRGRHSRHLAVPAGNPGGLARALRSLHRRGLVIGSAVVSSETRRTTTMWSLTAVGREMCHVTLSCSGEPHG